LISRVPPRPKFTSFCLAFMLGFFFRAPIHVFGPTPAGHPKTPLFPSSYYKSNPFRCSPGRGRGCCPLSFPTALSPVTRCLSEMRSFSGELFLLPSEFPHRVLRTTRASFRFPGGDVMRRHWSNRYGQPVGSISPSVPCLVAVRFSPFPLILTKAFFAPYELRLSSRPSLFLFPKHPPPPPTCFRD